MNTDDESQFNAKSRTPQIFLFIDLKAGGHRTPLPLIVCLLADTEFFDHRAVSVDVLVLEIVEKITSVSDHFEKSSS